MRKSVSTCPQARRTTEPIARPGIVCTKATDLTSSICVYYVEPNFYIVNMNHAMIPTVDGATNCPSRIDTSRRHGSLGMYVRAPYHSDFFVVRENKIQNGMYNSKIVCRAARDKARDQEVRGVEQPELIRPPDRLVWTKFVAETLLPTSYGKFRVRGYRHTVSCGRIYLSKAQLR